MTSDELIDVLVNFTGKDYLTPYEVHLINIAQQELAWTQAWESWGKK